MNVLVLGVGNILLSDEGAGVRVIEALQERYDVPETVAVVDGGTCGMDLLDTLADRDHLIVVDAVHTGSPPGTVVRIDGRDIPAVFRTNATPHQLGLQEVLAKLILLERAPARVTVIGVQPACLDLGLALSEAVARRIDDILRLLIAELPGIVLRPDGRVWPTAAELIA
ncbi:MAG: HyaD/HybD family hydrogenase maturation endopeptidase [Rhodospirillales bacterium]|nr:HyaD/HybD family hydrogenase maturation endopeptidase [Rhodospirillales bacterium]